VNVPGRLSAHLSASLGGLWSFLPLFTRTIDEFAGSGRSAEVKMMF